MPVINLLVHYIRLEDLKDEYGLQIPSFSI